jgi:hypothetical protein
VTVAFALDPEVDVEVDVDADGRVLLLLPLGTGADGLELDAVLCLSEDGPGFDWEEVFLRIDLGAMVGVM